MAALAHIGGDALEHALHRQPRRAQVFEQVAGVQPIAARAIGGDAARAGGKVQQRARGSGVQFGQAALGAAETAGVGVVAASVDQQQFHPGFGLVQTFQPLTQVDAVERHIGLDLDDRIDRRQVVHPFDLQAVAGVEQHHVVPGLDAVGEGFQRAANVVAAQVAHQRDVKTELAQGFVHGHCVIDGVFEGGQQVVFVADDQGQSGGFSHTELPPQPHGQQPTAEPPETTPN